VSGKKWTPKLIAIIQQNLVSFVWNSTSDGYKATAPKAKATTSKAKATALKAKATLKAKNTIVSAGYIPDS